MKNFKTIMLLFSMLLCLISCTNSKKLYVRVEHSLKTTPATSMVYEVKGNTIKVELKQKKLPFGKRETTYSKTLTKSQIEDLVNFIEFQKLDTLKNNYKSTVGESLLTTTIQIKRKDAQTVNCKLENITVMAADNLYNYLDDLIDNSSFKFGKKSN